MDQKDFHVVWISNASLKCVLLEQCVCVRVRRVGTGEMGRERDRLTFKDATRKHNQSIYTYRFLSSLLPR